MPAAAFVGEYVKVVKTVVGTAGILVSWIGGNHRKRAWKCFVSGIKRRK